MTLSLFSRKHKALAAFFAVLLLFLLLFSGDRLALVMREKRYLPLVYEAAAEFDVPPAMVLAVIRAESSFRPRAVSAAGARGLMQLMPETFLWLCEEKLEEELPPERIDDPNVNIRFGTYYLSYLYDRFQSWPIALAAYNAGEGRVEEWLADPTLDIGRDIDTIPFPETAAYVKKVEKYYHKYLNYYADKGEKT